MAVVSFEGLDACTFFAVLCLVSSLITNDHSFVDRLWSITPAVYSLQSAYLSGLQARPALMAFLATLWAVRLTYNFYRKGGYTVGKGEDYRWVYLKSRYKNIFVNDSVWFVFNVVFICGYQHFLLWLLSRPACLASQGDEELNAMDAVACSCFVFFSRRRKRGGQSAMGFPAKQEGEGEEKPKPARRLQERVSLQFWLVQVL